MDRIRLVIEELDREDGSGSSSSGLRPCVVYGELTIPTMTSPLVEVWSAFAGYRALCSALASLWNL